MDEDIYEDELDDEENESYEDENDLNSPDIENNNQNGTGKFINSAINNSVGLNNQSGSNSQSNGGNSAIDAAKSQVNGAAKEAEKKLIKEASKAALASFGAPPPLTDAVVDRILDSEKVDQTLDKINNKVLNPGKSKEDQEEQKEVVETEESVDNADGYKDSEDEKNSPEKKSNGCGCFITSIIMGIFAPILIIGFVFFVATMLVFAPIDATLNALNGLGTNMSNFWEKTDNFINWRGFNTDEVTFYNKLNERYLEYNEESVLIDVPLIVSILYYNEVLDEDVNFECEEENCENIELEETDFDFLRDNVDVLVDNMVKITGKKYFCDSTYYGHLVYDDYGQEVMTPSTKNSSFCGYSKKNCICPIKDSEPDEYKIREEDLYELKTKDEYVEWLKQEFIEQFLIDKGYELPNNSDEKDDFINAAIEHIYSVRDQYLYINNKLGSVEGSYGYFIPDAGDAGPIPERVLDNLDNPLGYVQGCVQTACFGYYSSNPASEYYCKKNPEKKRTHNGVDLGNNGGTPDIYSIADGQVIAISYLPKTCNPNIAANRSDPSCFGTSITIRHTLEIDGEVFIITSKYVHLSSFSNSSWPYMFASGQDIFVYKGQNLGKMGKTGLSDGVHLHFSLFDANNKKYNPEELLARRSDCKLLNCNSVRAACDG